MRYKLFKLFITYLFISILLVGCDSANTEEGDVLLSVSFQDDWLEEQEGSAIIFISSSDGQLLAEKEWRNNAELELHLKTNILTSSWDESEVTVTIAYNYQAAGEKTVLFSVMNVPVGSSWTFKGTGRPERLSDDASVSFSAVPNTEGYALSSKWYWWSSADYPIEDIAEFSLYENPEKAMISITTPDSGRYYGWVQDLQPGNQVISLDNLQPMQLHTINFETSPQISSPGPGRTERRFTYIYGYENPGNRTQGRYLFDRQEALFGTGNLGIEYPDTTFSDFRTFISSVYYTEDQIAESWQKAIRYGDLPTNIESFDADFEFESTGLDNFSVQTTGEFTELVSTWSNHEQAGETTVWWDVLSNNTTTQYKLPALPQSVVQRFGIDSLAFTLTDAELRNYHSVNTYLDLLSKRYENETFFIDLISGFDVHGKNYLDQSTVTANKIHSIDTDVYNRQNDDLFEDKFLNQ